MSDQPYEPESFAELYPGRFITALDIGENRPVVTIEKVWIEALEGEKGTEDKVVVTFVGKKKAYVLPKINALSFAKMFGPNVKAWRGRRVVLYATADLMPIKRGQPCIRVWGSPDIASDIKMEWKPKKRTMQQWTLHATGRQGQEQPQSAADDAAPFDPNAPPPER